jgi:microcystin-dependent protein
MSEPFLGEIRMVGFTFAPRGWAFCNGQIMSLAQNQALFSLLGTTYGGDGITTFALPDLRGRVPIHCGNSTGPGLSSYNSGQLGGTENVTLLPTQLPAHSHPVNAVAAGGNSASPSGNLPAIESTGTSLDYSTAGASATMSSAMIGNNSGGQPHSNIQPYLAINFIIALQGIFPSRN